MGWRVRQFPRTLVAGLALIASAILLPSTRADAAPTCFGRVATLVGTAGDDSLVGTDGVDVIAGLGGNDLIAALTGSDRICGGNGRDALRPDEGNDRVSGGGGNDYIENYYGDDLLIGGRGKDDFNESASFGNDSLKGGPGTDVADYEHEVVANLSAGTATGTNVGSDTLAGIEDLHGGSDRVVFIGDSKPNQLTGNEGRDRIEGRGGNDVLAGDELADFLDGGSGNDTCYGYRDTDTLISCEVVIP